MPDLIQERNKNAQVLVKAQSKFENLNWLLLPTWQLLKSSLEGISQYVNIFHFHLYDWQVCNWISTSAQWP